MKCSRNREHFALDMDANSLGIMENVTMKLNSSLVRNHGKITFTWYDYTLFISMMVGSVLIGIYFGFIKKQATANDYLFGGRTMKPIPIAMSLVASQISGLALLSIPSDIYQFGINYWLSSFSVAITGTINAYIYLPVFHGLQLTSAYEYLKLRFNTKIRLLASFLFTLSVFLHLPLVIYVPALALEEVTEINIHVITPIICAVCIFYTTIGGLKTVVWTDMLQFSLTIIALLVVFYLGVVTAGGFENIFNKAAEGERFSISFDIDPTVRDSFWVVIVGWSVHNLAHIATSQNCIQKYMAVPTLNDARLVLGLYIFGTVLIKTICVLTGLIMYSMYVGCDPILSGQIDKPDKILPYYVMDVSMGIPGLPGLFIAGILCASLSTLSASMNCVSGTIYEDFVSRYMPKTITQEKINNILKTSVVIVGIISTLLVYIVEHLGNLLPLIISFSGVATGPLLGLFTVGVLFPKVKAKAAYIGTITGLITIAFYFVIVQYYKALRLIQYLPKPASIDYCDFEFTPKNSTIFANENKPDVHFIFRISYYYYTLMGALIVIIVCNLMSLFTQDDSPPVHPDLLSPIIRPLITKAKIDYHIVDHALNMVTFNTASNIDTANNGKINT